VSTTGASAFVGCAVVGDGVGSVIGWFVGEGVGSVMG